MQLVMCIFAATLTGACDGEKQRIAVRRGARAKQKHPGVKTPDMSPMRPAVPRAKLPPCTPVPCSACGKRYPGKGVLKRLASFRDYEIRIYDTGGRQRVEVLHRGKSVFHAESQHWSFGSSWSWDREASCFALHRNEAKLQALRRTVPPTAQKKNELEHLTSLKSSSKWLEAGANLSGNKIPNLVLFSWERHYGKATIFELGNRLRKVDQVDLGYAGGESSFVDLDGDEYPEIEANDTIFIGWNACSACSPRPRVRLKLRNKRFRASVKLMRKPPLSERTLMALVTRARSHKRWSDTDAPVDTWGVMARLVYSGNVAQAHEFLRLAWPHKPGVRGFEEDGPKGMTRSYSRAGFWRLFLRNLRRSTHYKELVQLNGGKL